MTGRKENIWVTFQLTTPNKILDHKVDRQGEPSTPLDTAALI